MACRDLCTDSVAALGNDGIAEGNDVNALLQHAVSKLAGDLGIVQHDGNDCRVTLQNVEAQLADLLAEVCDVGMDLVTQLCGSAQHLEDLDGGNCDSGRQGVGEQVGTAALTQQVDDLLTAGCKAAGSAAQSLTQCGCDDVNTALNTAVLSCAAACSADETCGVRVVDHDQSAELVSQIADALQVGNVAVHGEDAVCSDQLDAAILSLFQLSAQIFHVVVLVTESLSLAETDAVDDGGVVQLVGDDCIIGTEQCLEQTGVSVEAGCVQDGVICTQEVGDCLLQVLVDLLCAADETDGGQTEAPVVVAVLSSFDQSGVVGQAQVVVGAHVDNALSLCCIDTALLLCCDDSLSLECAGFLNAFYFVGKKAQCFLCIHWKYPFQKLSIILSVSRTADQLLIHLFFHGHAPGKNTLSRVQLRKAAAKPARRPELKLGCGNQRSVSAPR